MIELPSESEECKKQGKFYIFRTVYDGIFVRTAKKEELNVPKRVLRTLNSIAKKHRKIKERKDDIEKRYQDIRKRAIAVGEENPKVAGIISEKTGIYLNITPCFEYNQDQLREDAKRTYFSVATGNRVYSVSFPLSDLPTNDDIVDMKEAFLDFVKEQGYSEEEAQRMVSDKVVAEVATDKVNDLIESGTLKLSEGTRTMKSWTVESGYINPQEKKTS